MKKQRINIVGLGQIGTAVLDALSEHRGKFEIFGTDKNFEIFEKLENKPDYMSTGILEADYYLICVWTMDQILDVIEEIGDLRRFDGVDPLIIVESTFDLSRMGEFSELVARMRLGDQVCTVPHRWNPGDPNHGVFNQNRVLGANNPLTLKRLHEFYGNFMPKEMMFLTDFLTAAASKVCENAYRFMEIVIAQEMATATKLRGLDWNILREAMNTKWNIDVREALYGVGGKCLPKDIGIFNNAFPTANIFSYAAFLNEQYKQRVAESGVSGPSV